MNHTDCIAGYLLVLVPIIYCLVVDFRSWNWMQQRFSTTRTSAKPKEELASHQEQLLAASASSLSNLDNEDWWFTTNRNRASSTIQNQEWLDILQQPGNIALWFTLIATCYVVLRSTANYLNWRRSFKFVASDIQGMQELLLRAFVLYVAGNVSSRLVSSSIKIRFACFIVYFLFAYSLTFESCPNIELGGNGSGSINIVWSFLLVSPIVFALIYVLLRNGFAECAPSRRRLCLGVFAIWTLSQMAMIYTASPLLSVHLHHHHWAFVLALVCRSPDSASFVGQAAAVAVFIHGIAMFGREDVLAWKAEAADSEMFEALSSTCEESMVCPVWKCIVPIN